MQRWVIKIGSALLTSHQQGLNRNAIKSFTEQISALRNGGVQVILVSSGAVAEGVSRFGWKTRPSALHDLQAAAAVGQMGLIEAWQNAFNQFGLRAAQVLLTHEDIDDRGRYLNARNTLRTLLELDTIPIINENDTVATDEIRFGDNDTLAGMVTNLVEAEKLIILTDQEGLFDQDPRLNPGAKMISSALASDPALDNMASNGSGELGRGGMITKLQAARLAARSGALTLILSGRSEKVLLDLLQGLKVGTTLLPDREPLAARKLWLAGNRKPRGRIILDLGAERVLQSAGSSLLPVGVTGVDGQFSSGDLVSCLDSSGKEIARGLTNYSSEEAMTIKGMSSDAIRQALGYSSEPELIHRDNLVLL